jgi:hypothetical protein
MGPLEGLNIDRLSLTEGKIFFVDLCVPLCLIRIIQRVQSSDKSLFIS